MPTSPGDHLQRCPAPRAEGVPYHLAFTPGGTRALGHAREKERVFPGLPYTDDPLRPTTAASVAGSSLGRRRLTPSWRRRALARTRADRRRFRNRRTLDRRGDSAAALGLPSSTPLLGIALATSVVGKTDHVFVLPCREAPWADDASLRVKCDEGAGGVTHHGNRC